MHWFIVWSGYWQCAWCGQANPNHSNTCWKCGASK